MKGRRLVTTEIMRHLGDSFICNIDEIPLDRVVSSEELIAKEQRICN